MGWWSSGAPEPAPKGRRGKAGSAGKKRPAGKKTSRKASAQKPANRRGAKPASSRQNNKRKPQRHSGMSARGQTASGGRRGNGGRNRGGRGAGAQAGRPRRRGFHALIYWGTVAAIWGAIAFGALIFYYSQTLPNPLIAGLSQRGQSMKVLAADGSILAERGLSKNYVRLSDLPRHVADAVVAIEDRRFYSHLGFDPVGFGRAMVENIKARRWVQGGSTLTQQLAKNLFLSSDRTVKRKLREMGMALWLEYKFHKDEILELYLNRVYFGHQAYGIDQAARRYFGKHATKLTLPEAAMLAGALKAPSLLNPKRNIKAARARADLVLAAMSDAGFISPLTAKTASLSPAKVQKRDLPINSNYIADWIAELVPEYVTDFSSDLVIETSINKGLQTAANKFVNAHLNKNGKRYRVGQAAVVTMAPNGAVKAIIGGKNYQKSQFNRAIHSRRQTGSVFKPMVYLTALEAGFRPDSIIFDEPTKFNNWQPKNYKNKYHGQIPLTTALALSSNVAAVKLMGTVGVAKTIATARRLGMRGEMKRHLSLALGTAEQSLMGMTASYAPFANGGRGVVPFVITRIRTVKGRELYRHQAHTLGQVIEASHVNEMNAMLRQVVQRGTGRGARLGDHDYAGKTGTTQNFRDGWFIGYSGYFITGVWVGNDNGRPMKRVTGGGLPTRIWSDVMKAAHKGLPPRWMVATSREPVSYDGWREVGATRRIKPQFFEKALR